MFSTVIEAQQLREHLQDPRFIVVDCRHSLADFSLGRRQYDEEHIEGAFFADVENDLAGAKTGTNGRHPLPDPHDFGKYLQLKLGADDNTQLVAYDAGGDMYAARFWFLCRWNGHHNVAVLNGGYQAWKAGGFPVGIDIPRPRRSHGVLTIRQHPEMIVDANWMLRNLNDSSVHILDGRAADRFAGENETIDPIAGHIPGAQNRWFKENFGEDLRFKTPDQLREEFQRFGAPSNIVHNCGSGVSASVNYLAMTIAGLLNSKLYAGSWSEWIADPSRPIA